ncbi:hypothetical protein BDP27DRAFT_1333895 [Rhodocollybia butyracea]|uniref:Uncharacterized protein n=1 Tax=Rhodocollybia butyracea TaxID=206335 RepID=A0A9P5U357_9AGAR|nr:hypothetical protein BDP27DRAFT_1333895 [Rhodocollybia butyracea]
MSVSILESGFYTITSLSGEGGDAGPVVTFPPGEESLKWEVTRTPEGTYRISIGGYRYTGVLDRDEEQNQEWIFTSFHKSGARSICVGAFLTYSIQLADRSKAWTTENHDPKARSHSLPPQATPPQLFRITHARD